MATSAVYSTPTKARHGNVFSTRLAGGRLPLTPSPRRSHEQAESIHRDSNNRLLSKLSRPANGARSSPKSNIASANSQVSPRRALRDASDFTLVGTGPRPSSSKSTTTTPKRQRGQVTGARTPKRGGSKTNNVADRFIPNRTTSEGIMTNGGALKLMNDNSSTRNTRPKSSAGDGSAALAAGAASVLDIGRPRSSYEQLSLDGLSINDDHNDDDDDDNDQPRPKALSPASVAYQKTLAEAISINLDQRILSYKPAAPQSQRPADLRSQYLRPLKPEVTANHSKRKIGTAPERVLDAPGLVDDYYLNLLDWSSGNQVAIALDRSVYVWSASTGSVNSLLECDANTYISSVKWSADGAYLAAGLGTGEVQIWDIEDGTKLRSMDGHANRVSVMGWNKHVLSTGDRDGLVVNHDVRVADHQIAKLNSHTSEVCGLEWRADGSHIATGGNDNLVAIWDARKLDEPKFEKTNHRAAVKAVSWCPWQSNLLATGGGSNDRNIHFWNTTTGARVNSIETGSQVTSIRWSMAYKELVSTGGFPDNSLSVWAYPSLVKNYEIPAHESRILGSTLSPCGQMLATVAADESLKFWKVFEKKSSQANLTAGKGSTSSLASTSTIR